MSKRTILPGEAAPQARPFASVLTDPLQAASSSAGRRLNRQLEELREQARAEGYAEGLASGREQGRQEGYREGLEAAMAEVERRTRAGLEELAQTLQRVDECFGPLMDRFFANCEEALAPLALAIAVRLLAKELQADPAAAMGLAREALAEVTHAESARIRVHPFHGAVLRERMAELLAASESLRRIEVVDDPTVAAGVIVDSAGGVIDATLPTRVRNLVRQTLGETFLPREGDEDEAVAA
ncbi:MAG: FliH/SctL family protein [Fimbriimonadaceae bacterium]